VVDSKGFSKAKGDAMEIYGNPGAKSYFHIFPYVSIYFLSFPGFTHLLSIWSKMLESCPSLIQHDPALP
jgi:hypothetical protein